MIPKLFSPTATKYDNNGLGALVDALSCEVTEERNGIFELKMQYVVDGHLYDQISVDCQILAKANDIAKPQVFRIYNISKELNGVVTINAEHISYQLTNVYVRPFASDTAGEFMDDIKDGSLWENPFSFSAADDIKNHSGRVVHQTPVSVRALLGGIEGSALDVYHGELEFDNYNVILHYNRGKDNGVIVSYGRNLIDFKRDERLYDVVTGVMTSWSLINDYGDLIKTVYSDLQTVWQGPIRPADIPLSYPRNIVVDVSNDFEEEPTKEQLNDLARGYLYTQNHGTQYTMKVEFIRSSKLDGDIRFADFENVGLCDMVTVKVKPQNVSAKGKVVKTVYDTLKEEYVKIQVDVWPNTIV